MGEELDRYWHFKWDDTFSVAWNTYRFHSMLRLYQRQCRRWEEHHGGSCCLVERVRDKYVMPKVREFLIHLESLWLSGTVSVSVS